MNALILDDDETLLVPVRMTADGVELDPLGDPAILLLHEPEGRVIAAFSVPLAAFTGIVFR